MSKNFLIFKEISSEWINGRLKYITHLGIVISQKKVKEYIKKYARAMLENNIPTRSSILFHNWPQFVYVRNVFVYEQLSLAYHVYTN